MCLEAIFSKSCWFFWNWNRAQKWEQEILPSQSLLCQPLSVSRNSSLQEASVALLCCSGAVTSQFLCCMWRSYWAACLKIHFFFFFDLENTGQVFTSQKDSKGPQLQVTHLHYSRNNQSPNQPSPSKWLPLVLSPLHSAFLTLPGSIQFSSTHLQIQANRLGSWAIRLSFQKCSTSRVPEDMEHQQTCLLQASAPGTIHFLPTNAINTKLLLITADCKDRKLGSKKKGKKEEEAKNKPMHQLSRGFIHKDSIFYRPSFLSRWTICIWGRKKYEAKKKIWKW